MNKYMQKKRKIQKKNGWKCEEKNNRKQEKYSRCLSFNFYRFSSNFKKQMNCTNETVQMFFFVWLLLNQLMADLLFFFCLI